MSETLNALRNIEIKARICDSIEFERKIEIAKKLTQNYTVIKQRDVFFNVTSGRLKLRFLEVQLTFFRYILIPLLFCFNVCLHRTQNRN